MAIDLATQSPGGIAGSAFINQMAAAVEAHDAWIEDVEAAWQTWALTWTASVNPAIGNGTLAARYKEVGDLIVAEGGFLAGTTTTFGTGQWSMNLPVNAAQPGSPLNDPYVGLWHGFDASAPAHRGGRVLLGSATSVTFHTHADPAGGVTATGPITWANTDRFAFLVVYERA